MLILLFINVYSISDFKKNLIFIILTSHLVSAVWCTHLGNSTVVDWYRYWYQCGMGVHHYVRPHLLHVRKIISHSKSILNLNVSTQIDCYNNEINELKFKNLIFGFLLYEILNQNSIVSRSGAHYLLS